LQINPQMKAILFLAVLVLAAQSNPLNEVYQSFLNNLPMNAEQKNYLTISGASCLNSAQELIMTTFSSVQRDIQGKNIIALLKDVILAEDALENKIVPQCISTFQILVSYFQRSNQTSSSRFEENFSEFILRDSYVSQNLARALESLARNQFANAGKLLADALKAQYYIMKPELGEVVQRNYTKYTPFDEERFIREFVSSLLKELGANQNQINGTVACVRDLVNVTKTVIANPALHRGDKFTAVHAFLESAMMITDSLHRCEQEVDLNPLQQLAGLFMRYPLQLVFRVYINGYLEKLTMARSMMNFNEHGAQGDYTLAGKDLADWVKANLREIVY